MAVFIVATLLRFCFVVELPPTKNVNEGMTVRRFEFFGVSRVTGARHARVTIFCRSSHNKIFGGSLSLGCIVIVSTGTMER